MSFVRLVAIARDEAAYLAEWVHHHLYFGFDQIAVILNGCSDNSRHLLEKISRREARLLIRDGDFIKASCQQSGENFQIAAYAEELRLIRRVNFITHVMCLDIDEFWVKPELNSSIHDYIARYPEFDSMAFAWHVEHPHNPDLFSSALQTNYLVQKDRHVKALHRVSDRLTYLDIHNAVHEEGNYQLADGRIFPRFTFNGSERAALPDDLYFSQQNNIDPAFVYHRVFRSQQEYLASLQRGRPSSSACSLKSNRWGYVPYDPETPVIRVEHPAAVLQDLHADFDRFVQQHQLTSDIELGQLHAKARCAATIKALADGGEEVNRLLFLFKGIMLKHVPELASVPPEITHHIDGISKTSNGFLIKGWVIDRYSERTVDVRVFDLPLAKISRIARPDVVKHYPGKSIDNGFQIEINGIELNSIKVDFTCDNSKCSIEISLP